MFVLCFFPQSRLLLVSWGDALRRFRGLKLTIHAIHGQLNRRKMGKIDFHEQRIRILLGGSEFRTNSSTYKQRIVMDWWAWEGYGGGQGFMGDLWRQGRLPSISRLPVDVPREVETFGKCNDWNDYCFFQSVQIAVNCVGIHTKKRGMNLFNQAIFVLV